MVLRLAALRLAALLLATSLAPVTLLPIVARAQSSKALPFGIGERLVYRVRVGKVGRGRGVMSVEGPVDVRGTSTYLLRSEVHAGIGFVNGSNTTESWLDPLRMASLRFHKHERHALKEANERVELYPEEQRWTEERGPTGRSPSNDPLDELSFMYFVRTLPLDGDTTEQLVRHYDGDRNPIEVRVVGRDTLTTPAGTFPTILVEMRVKDPRRYRGEGLIRMQLSDDALHMPVRIESTVPVLGMAVMTLESYRLAPTHVARAKPEE